MDGANEQDGGAVAVEATSQQVLDWFEGKTPAPVQGGLKDGEDPQVNAEIDAALEGQPAEGDEDGAPEGDDPPSPDDAAPETVEVTFGQQKFDVPTALKPLADEMGKAVRGIQSASDRKISQLEAKIEGFMAGRGQQASAGNGTSANAPSPARQPAPADKFAERAKKLDERFGADGEFAQFFHDFAAAQAQFVAGTARAVREDVDRSYEMVRLPVEMRERLQAQLEGDVEDEVLGELASKATVEDLAPFMLAEITKARKAGRGYSEYEVYQRALINHAKGGATKKVSQAKEINGNGHASPGASGNGQSPDSSRSAFVDSGGLGKSIKRPAAMRGSGNGTVSAQRNADAQEFARHRPRI